MVVREADLETVKTFADENGVVSVYNAEVPSLLSACWSFCLSGHSEQAPLVGPGGWGGGDLFWKIPEPGGESLKTKIVFDSQV
jgi:hypothetical protein